jgi:hypothetical protein
MDGSFIVRRLPLATLLFVLLLPPAANAQDGRHLFDPLEIGVQAIGVVTRESPAIQGRSLTEGYLTQPVIMAQLDPWREALSLKTTLDLEGVTLKRGELNAGIYGEGYIDRRHPHTYLHELLLTSAQRFGAAGASGVSITVGKGFAPFGTDDPMARPFEKYPINHHLAQILERAIAIGALRAGAWIFEAGAFNGDEPTGPGATPSRKRYWDSWSGRISFLPWPLGELQTSYARVKSPEIASGGGADQRKQSASIRLEGGKHSEYALFDSARYDRLSGALRIERTDRPDEQRLVELFRTPVPATDLSIAGRSRWTIITTHVGASLVNARSLKIEPFAEMALALVRPTLEPSGFDPRQFYGSDHIWSASVGARLAFGMSHMRMRHLGNRKTK